MNGHRRICDEVHGCGKIYHGSLENCPHCNNPSTFSDEIRMQDNDYIYDIESYPNAFTMMALHAGTESEYEFEISPWRNDILQLIEFLKYLHNNQSRMVGFKNVDYDYPVIHEMLQWGEFADFHTAYNKSMQIINGNNKFDHMVWPSDRFVTQVDLFKIHHFDNNAKRTSLKVIEINMRSNNVEDLPFPPGTVLTEEQMPILRSYNKHDARETYKFYKQTIPMIEFRESLSEKYGKDYLNHNDTKIGKDFFIDRLESELPGSCYTKIPGKGRIPNQTHRTYIHLAEVIFPYINFKRTEFEIMKNWLSIQMVDASNIKGFFTDVSCSVNGFSYDFGAGGIHGSVESTIVSTDDEGVVIDLDVASYYPNLAIKNKLYPYHLSDQFCEIYEDLYNQRKTFSKGSPENAMLKLALNGTYGASNDVYSPFYDPQFTLSITINGQLLLCVLAEWMLEIPSLEMIQINTDGLTVKCPHEQVHKIDLVKKAWEDFTCLELERVDYKRMYIRDVNNYIAEGLDGKIKRIGTYAHELQADNPGTRELVWHKNHSFRVVALAAEAALVHEIDIEEFITSHRDPFDFMGRAKIPRNSRLILTTNGVEQQLQNTSRYYVTTDGGSLAKIMPPIKRMMTPLKHSVTGEETASGNKQDIKKMERQGWEKMGEPRMMLGKERVMSIEKGYLVSDTNDIKNFSWNNINYQYYITEAEKIVNPLEQG